MRIDKIRVRPVEKSLNPELEFEVEMYIERNLEIPLEIRGSIFAEDNLKIATIYEATHNSKETFSLAAIDTGSKGEEKIKIKLSALLNHRALDHLETLRDKNPKGDVALNLEIFIKILRSKTRLSHMFPLEVKSLTSSLPDHYKDAKPVYYQFYKHGFNTSYTNMWILSGDSGPNFLEIQNNTFTEKIVIPSSDWIHDYSPVFQIGRFLVFEYQLPDYMEGAKNPIVEILNKAINAIKEMEENIRKGEWDQVIEDSRGVWELLRNEKEFKELLIRAGYTKEAFEDLYGALRKLFDFSSKFHHKLDKKGEKIMEDIKISKEDAYLVYTVAINIVNLFLKKIRRLRGDYEGEIK